MTDFKEIGKNQGATRKEAQRNLNRAKANFPYSQRSVDDVDTHNVYRKEFNIGEGTSVSLDLDIRERPTPCTVNPPDAGSYHHSTWHGEYINGPCYNHGGECVKYGFDVLRFWKLQTTDSTTGGYQVIQYGEIDPELTGSAIILPYDGCYLVEAYWSGYGVSYKNSGGWSMVIWKVGYSWENSFQMSTEMGSTGYIAILGPILYYFPAPNRLIGIVEAKAGELIRFQASGSSFGQCYDWVAGTCLKGMGVPGDGHLKITLLGTAADVTLTHDKDDPQDTPLKVLQCIQNNIILSELNLLIDFYNRLTAKGELPYPEQYPLTPQDQWINFWADYWYRLGWLYRAPDFPDVAPNMFEYLMLDGSTLGPYNDPLKRGLRNYQAEWASRITDCSAIENPDANACSMYTKIFDQLLRLQDFYNTAPPFPIYIAISGTTEPTFFEDWATFWAWVWDRGYSMEQNAYVMQYVWTIERQTLTKNVTPWPPPTTIEELNSYVDLYQSNVSGCS